MKNVTDVISFSKSGKHASLLIFQTFKQDVSTSSLLINDVQALTIFRSFGRATQESKTLSFALRMKKS